MAPTLQRLHAGTLNVTMRSANCVRYFLWDTYVSIRHYRDYGPSFVFHGVVCFTVFLLGLGGPFAFYFGGVFLMFELSTPFLNIHWFLDKVNYR